MLFGYLLVLVAILVIVMVTRRPRKLLDLYDQTRVSFPYVPVIGHAYKFIGTHEDRMKVFDAFGRQGHSNKYGLASFWFAHYLCVSISDPVSACAVLKTCFDKWPITYFMRHLLGNGAVFGDEEIWRLRRKILNPIFSGKYFEQYARVFERNSAVMMEELAGAAGRGDCSLWRYFSSYAMDSAFDMSFGENLDAQRQPAQPFAAAFQQYFENISVRMCQPWLFSSAVYQLLPASKQQDQLRKTMWDTVENLIVKKKKMLKKERLSRELEQDYSRVHGEFKSFLDLLIEFSGGEEGYTDTELREETLMIILGATDTSATTACFATVLLANHPEVQQKVYQEVRDILCNSERSLVLDDLPKLMYLDAVVKESLRLYSPVPVFLRRCTKDVELPSGVTLPQGCEVMLNIWGIHRNPDVWGPDADRFRPERFLTATPDQLAAFMPFGYGPRSCTGMRLALASLKLSLAELVRRFRIAPAHSYQFSAQQPLRVTFELMLKHVHRFTVRLENRTEKSHLQQRTIVHHNLKYS